MIVCAHVRPTLLAFSLGLEPEEAAPIEAHLKSCPECLGVFFQQQRVSHEAAAFEQRPAPALQSRLRARVGRRAFRPRPRTVLALGLAAVAAALLLTLALRSPPASEAPAGPLLDAPPALTYLL